CSLENCQPGRFWPVNSPTLLVYKESQRNKITCPPLELKRASVAHGSKNRPALEVSAWGEKRGRRERAPRRFWRVGFRRVKSDPWDQWRSGAAPCRRWGNRPSCAECPFPDRPRRRRCCRGRG